MGRPKSAKNKAAAKPATADVAKTVSKARAVREALSAGMDSPGEIADFAKSNFGLEIPKMRASAYKAQVKARGSRPAKRGRPPKSASHPRIVPAGEGDLLDALEAMRPLVASLGVEKVKSHAELLG